MEDAREANGQFGAGNPGRKPGSKNKLSTLAKEAALQLLETNTEVFVKRLAELLNDRSKSARIEGLKIFASIMGRVLPSKLDLHDDESETPHTIIFETVRVVKNAEANEDRKLS